MTLGRLLISGSALILLTSGTVALMRLTAGRSAGPPLRTRAASAPEVRAQSPGPVAASLAGELLDTLPGGVTLEDIRVFWPAPRFSVRGHAGWTPDRVSDLEAWGARWSRTGGAATPRLEGWFRRLDTGPDRQGLVSFEFVLRPDSSIVASPAATSPDRVPRPLVDPAWSDLLLEAGRWGGARLVSLESEGRPGLRAAFAGSRTELLATLEWLERSRLPMERAWLGVAESGRGGLSLLIDVPPNR